MAAPMVEHPRSMTPEEQRIWRSILERYGDSMRAELARALFDDVRPEWEAWLEKRSVSGAR